MERQEFLSNLKLCFEENGLFNLIDDDKADRLFALYECLVEANKITNLTAITDPNGVILKHFVDCATVCKHIPQSSRVIDVGCGAGFPSLPLSILRKDLTVVGLDSTGKKIDYINKTSSKLGISNITAVCARAEDYAFKERESFDVCVSRAVARLNVLSEICIPLVKIGGSFIAMKSNKGNEEYEEAKRGIAMLGCDLELVERTELTLFEEVVQRETYLFNKSKNTPTEHPRKYAQILKKPL